MSRKLLLSFSSGELIETYFAHPILDSPARAIRGKSIGAYKNYGNFQWTSAVQALSLLLLKSTRVYENVNICNSLIGGEGSLATSLDYAITKNPNWINDMFGADKRGEAILRRIVLRTNPNRKRPGPVVIGVNSKFLPPDEIVVVVEGLVVNDAEHIQQLIDTIEANSERTACYVTGGLSNAIKTENVAAHRKNKKEQNQEVVL